MNSRRNHLLGPVATLMILLPFVLISSPGFAEGFDPANATYIGIEEPPITLIDGIWEGAPYMEGGNERPRVGLIKEFQLDDGHDRYGIFLWQNSGGTGVISYLALVVRTNGQYQNIATVPFADRSQFRGGTFAGDNISVDLVQAGPDDPACCPSLLVTRSWSIQGNTMEEKPEQITGTLSPATLAGTVWQLQRYSFETAAPEAPPITLTYRDGQFVGSGGCNNYFAKVESGDLAGDVKLGPIGATRKACPGEIDQDEITFFRYLQGAMKVGFYNGKMMIAYQDGEKYDSMLFIQHAAK